MDIDKVRRFLKVEIYKVYPMCRVSVNEDMLTKDFWDGSDIVRLNIKMEFLFLGSEKPEKLWWTSVCFTNSVLTEEEVAKGIVRGFRSKVSDALVQKYKEYLREHAELIN